MSNEMVLRNLVRIVVGVWLLIKVIVWMFVPER